MRAPKAICTQPAPKKIKKQVRINLRVICGGNQGSVSVFTRDRYAPVLRCISGYAEEASEWKFQNHVTIKIGWKLTAKQHSSKAIEEMLQHASCVKPVKNTSIASQYQNSTL